MTHGLVRVSYGPSTRQTVFGGSGGTSGVWFEGPIPEIVIRELGAAVDSGVWDLLVLGERLSLLATNDALADSESVLSVERTGIVIDLITLGDPVSGTPVQLNGPFGVNGTAPIARPAIAGSRGANVALAALLTALDAYGLITDNTVI